MEIANRIRSRNGTRRPSVPTSVLLDLELLEMIDLIAEEENVTRSDLIRHMMNEFVNNYFA